MLSGLNMENTPTGWKDQRMQCAHSLWKPQSLHEVEQKRGMQKMAKMQTEAEGCPEFCSLPSSRKSKELVWLSL